MSDYPSTFKGSTTASGPEAWGDRAVLMPAGQDANGMGGSVPLLRGTFAAMIRHIVQLPERDRRGYVIAKAGDRTYTAEEAMALASHPDFPAQDPG
jgi:hypothetical protein